MLGVDPSKLDALMLSHVITTLRCMNGFSRSTRAGCARSCVLPGRGGVLLQREPASAMPSVISARWTGRDRGRRAQGVVADGLRDRRHAFSTGMIGPVSFEACSPAEDEGPASPTAWAATPEGLSEAKRTLAIIPDDFRARARPLAQPQGKG